MKQVKRTIFPYLLISLFAMYQVSVLVFTHVHYINGVIITHSHPARGEHSHSNAECIYFNHLSSFFSFEPSVALSLLPQTLESCLLMEKEVTSCVIGVYLRTPGLRAPPFVG